MDSTVDQKAAKIVKDALDLLDPKGGHWVKGRFTRIVNPGAPEKKQVFGYCAVGALRQAAYGHQNFSNPHTPEYKRARKVLGDVVGFPNVTDWNDAPHRTFADVRDAFTTTLHRLRGK